jgi:Carboxypeptidase regulatory-like domain
MLGIPSIAGAQVVRGRVVDSAGAPVALAQVRVMPEGAAAITDAAGAFTLGPLPAGQYSLALRRVGFRADTVLVDVPLRDSVLTIRLTPIPVSLRGVTTSALEQDLPRLFDRMREHLGGVEFGPELRKKYGGMSVDEILKSDFNLRHYADGAKICGSTAVFLDGVWLWLVPPRPISDYVHMRDVAAIEAFPSPDFIHEPFLHPLPGACMPIVLIWTNGYKQKPWGGNH